ncbi:MAG: chemotaxis protein CheB [Polyangiaceae bacterium]
MDENDLPGASAPHHVVGVGASAGGLEALEQLFSGMPTDLGYAFVVVQHLSPDFKSLMDELLARRTRLPVLQVENGVVVERDRIYLIPPKKEMIISGGRLLLSDKGAQAELSLPIDTFFRSLAQDLGPRAVGIVLSGGGSDGSRGIRDIHDAGGLVLCQDESTAAFDGMPRSARDTGVVDQIIPPQLMPGVLRDHVRHAEHAASLERYAAPPQVGGLTALFRYLEREFGIDFSYYKPNTVVRRIERRVQILHLSGLDAYVERVLADRAELDSLYRDLLIGVTRFFRDEEAFEQLERRIVPEILHRTPVTDEIRIWVPGCATGEEAYSIAILFHEQMEGRAHRHRIKIFATDVHTGSLEFGTRGLYSDENIGRVSPRRLERYFAKEGPNWQISAELRQLIVFARHNVVRDAPFTRVDLISCRNLLIYFQPVAQRKVLGLFHFALKREGILFLGPSENVSTLGDDLETLDTHWRIYRKHRELRISEPHPMLSPIVRSSTRPPTSVPSAPTLAQLIGVYDALLDDHMPPSLLLNERRELVHAFGGAGKFVRVQDGRPTLDILDLVEPELKLALAGALQRAAKEREVVSFSGVKLRVADEEKLFRVSVKPVQPRSLVPTHLLVTLEEGPVAESVHPHRDPPTDDDVARESFSRDRLRALEIELQYTKENLQATIEELETSNEELQATNEEMLASNEELQSTNEELQSVNEELYTVNAEHQKKIAQLTELTNDMDNLLLSTDIGTVFLDRALTIRKFTPRMSAIFNLLPQDVGRPIANFSSTLRHPGLLEDLAEVLGSDCPVEREVRDADGVWYFMRILPYRTRGKTGGVVLTLIDVRALKAAEDALFRERYLLDSLMQSVPDAIYFKDAKGRFVRINAAMMRQLGLSDAEEAIGKTTLDLLPEQVARTLDHADDLVLQGEIAPSQLEPRASHGAAISWFLTTRHPLRDKDGRIVGMCGLARDVTEQKEANDDVRLAVKRRDEFLAMLSHELRNPLGAIVSAARVLSEKQGAQADRSLPGARELDVIDRQSRHMARLLDDLLEANRITQNKINLDKRVVDLRRVVEDAASALAQSFVDRRISLSIDVPEHPVLVDGDPARLQQIVSNLLGNAAKFSEPGGRAALVVSTDSGDGGRRRALARLVVRDDGAGIESGLLGRIFELFMQGAATLARTEGGMGLGLALVRALTEMHGGRVWAESEGRGKGSSFHLELPLSNATTVPELEAHRRGSGAHESDRGLEGARVVLVDDNVDACSMLEAILEQRGCVARCAHDGPSALALIEDEPPDIAIVDIGLPGMDGYELARRLRRTESGRGLFLVALTGYGRPSDREASMAAGFDAHLVKPIPPGAIEQLIRDHSRPVIPVHASSVDGVVPS